MRTTRAILVWKPKFAAAALAGTLAAIAVYSGWHFWPAGAASPYTSDSLSSAQVTPASPLISGDAYSAALYSPTPLLRYPAEAQPALRGATETTPDYSVPQYAQQIHISATRPTFDLPDLKDMIGTVNVPKVPLPLSSAEDTLRFHLLVPSASGGLTSTATSVSGAIGGVPTATTGMLNAPPVNSGALLRK